MITNLKYKFPFIYKKWDFWPSTIKEGACVVFYIQPHYGCPGYVFVKDIQGVMWDVLEDDLYEIKI